MAAGSDVAGGAGEVAVGGVGGTAALRRYPVNVRKIESKRTNSMAFTSPVFVPGSGPTRVLFSN